MKWKKWLSKKMEGRHLEELYSLMRRQEANEAELSKGPWANDNCAPDATDSKGRGKVRVGELQVVSEVAFGEESGVG